MNRIHEPYRVLPALMGILVLVFASAAAHAEEQKKPAARSRGTREGELRRGGCIAGAYGCLGSGVPGGHVQNSGYRIPGRAWARILVLPAFYDAYRAFQGETAEEYLGIDDVSQVQGPSKGGCGPGVMSTCCWAGVPAGQMYNSLGTLQLRSLMRPGGAVLAGVGAVSRPRWPWFVGGGLFSLGFSLYDGYAAYHGQTLQEYAEIR